MCNWVLKVELEVQCTLVDFARIIYFESWEQYLATRILPKN